MSKLESIVPPLELCKQIPPLGNCSKCGAKLFRECWDGWGVGSRRVFQLEM